jgi:hypothetical protein
MYLIVLAGRRLVVLTLPICNKNTILVTLHEPLNCKQVILFFKFWTFSIVTLFINHYVSRDGSSLVLWWVQSMELASLGGHGMLSMLAIHSSCAEIWQWAIKRKDSIKIIKALC